jgi:diguanylate cyclase (GGDEF)-like protein
MGVRAGLRYRVVGAAVIALELGALGMLARSGLPPATVATVVVTALVVIVMAVRLLVLVDDRERAQCALDARARQQSVVARLGQRALDRVPPEVLLSEAAAAVQATLGVTSCRILELSHDGRTLECRAQAGSDAGPSFLPATADVPAGRAITGSSPVVVRNTMATSVLAAIGGSGRPYGVLETTDTRADALPPGEVDFLVTVAMLLGGAIARSDAEREIRHRAFHDPLSGLANRTLFRDRVDHALVAHRRDDATLAVLFCDLDDFKLVNDGLGHQAGDRVLVAVAERIAGCLRPEDTAARLGGDEFAVLLERIEGPAAALSAAQRILAALADPVPALDRYVPVSLSIGIAVTDGSITTSEALLRDADTAMYAAKSAGKSGSALFRPEMHANALERLELKGDLERALERGEMALAYQPIVALDDGEVVGAEALLRWHHPRRGVLGPAAFIPVAEQTGLIVPLGRWAVREACRRAATWSQEPGRPRRSVSVNLSARQLLDGRVVDDIAAALADSDLPPEHLLVELTETVLLAEESLSVLQELRKLGVRLALDDFGTGYSSLDHLRRVAPDVVKIDRTFVAALGRGQQINVARGIVALAASLGVSTVGEGVEDEQQRRELVALGCELGQGALFAMPLDHDDFVTLLTRPEVALRPGVYQTPA